MRETLNRFKPTCEIICWTAGHPEYANKVMDYIDPDRSIFDMRLFRDQCYVTSKGLYIKDLRMINRDLDRCILVDNYLYSFGFQIENGIMIVGIDARTVIGDLEAHECTVVVRTQFDHASLGVVVFDRVLDEVAQDHIEGLRQGL